MRLFCFGFGYAATYLASLMIEEGWSVTGTTRDQKSKQLPEHLKNVYLHEFNGSEPMDDIAVDALLGAEAVLVSIPPQRDSGVDAVINQHQSALLQSERLKWIGYISSTGVYGDHDGAEVTETSELRAAEGTSGYARILAESKWLKFHSMRNLPVHIFRPAGIYGLRRSPLGRIVKDNARIIRKPGHLFNRIHVEDMAHMLRASILKPTPGQIYNLADDHPAEQEEVLNYAFRLLNKEPPEPIPFDQAEMSPMLKNFFSANKVVSNKKIKETFDYELIYPSYKEGLSAIAEHVR